MRVLSEELFGVVAFAVSILLLVTSLRNFGLHFALLHHHDRIDQLAPTHFVVNVVLGGVGTAVLFVLASLHTQVAALSTDWLSLHDTASSDSLLPVILTILAGLEFIRNAALTSEIQLRRDLRFGRLAVSHAAATVFASVVGLTVAYLGGGIWALVLGYSVNSAGYVIAYCTLIWMHRPPPVNRLRGFDRGGARDLLRYGVWYWVGGIIQAFALQFDRLVVGLMLGTGSLGFYERAHYFAQMPTGAVTHAIVSVTGTVYARYQRDRGALSAAYRRTLRLILRSTVFISALLAIEAPGWTSLILGDRWLPMVPLLRWLIVYSVCRPVLDDIRDYLPATVELVGFAMLLTLLIGIPLGVRSAGNQGRFTDHTFRVFAILGVAMPIFWLGLVNQFLFYGKFQLLPIGGRLDTFILPPAGVTGLYLVDSLIEGNFETFWDALKHLILPAGTMAFGTLAVVARMTRTSMLECLGQDYIRTAKAKGVQKFRYTYVHALKNAASPILTVVGLQTGFLLAGDFLAETIFNWPGIGSYGVKAINTMDFPAIMGVTLLISLKKDVGTLTPSDFELVAYILLMEWSASSFQGALPSP